MIPMRMTLILMLFKVAILRRVHKRTRYIILHPINNEKNNYFSYTYIYVRVYTHARTRTRAYTKARKCNLKLYADYKIFLVLGRWDYDAIYIYIWKEILTVLPNLAMWFICVQYIVIILIVLKMRLCITPWSLLVPPFIIVIKFFKHMLSERIPWKMHSFQIKKDTNSWWTITQNLAC